MATYIQPETVLTGKSIAVIQQLQAESEQFVTRLLCDTGSLSKVEKAEKDFVQWKAKNGFDPRTDIEDISQALRDVLRTPFTYAVVYKHFKENAKAADLQMDVIEAYLPNFCETHPEEMAAGVGLQTMVNDFIDWLNK